MKVKILENLSPSRESRSYIDCLYTLLIGAGLFSSQKFMLSGMTGMAFKFITHKRLLPSSLDMYSWVNENWRAVDTLGIYTETYSGKPLNTTFPLYKAEAIKKIRNSIDTGKAVLSWGLRQSKYCLIIGYDDRDGVFFFKHPGDNEYDILLYENFGIVTEGDWFYQVIGDRIEKDVRDIYRDSLEIAVSEWECQYKVRSEYGSGRKAYQYILQALKNENFSEVGVYYALKVYIQSKSEIQMYLHEVVKELRDLKNAASKYTLLARIYSDIGALPFSGSPKEDRKLIPQLVEMFSEALEVEETAVGELKAYMKEYVTNKKINPSRLINL